ncbi:hypothetical protein ACHAWT_008936 [Skeletonema menzelii]
MSEMASRSQHVKHRIKWEDVLINEQQTPSLESSDDSRKNDVVDGRSTIILEQPSSSWVEQICMIPTSNNASTPTSTSSTDQTSKEKFNVVSWNVLAEQYLTPRSHPNLPKEYADVVFHKETRRQLLIDTLERFCSPHSFDNDTIYNKWDVLALQELDLHQPTDPIIPALESWGYQVVKTTSDQRRDCCAVVFDTSKFKLVRMEVVQFDDLATMKEGTGNNSNDGNTSQTNNNSGEQPNAAKKITFNNITPNKNKPASSELTGLVRSFLRRNCALIVHLEAIQSKQSFVVTSAHLYWHPGYEYVKTCQAKYLLDRVHSMATSTMSAPASAAVDRIPTIICGDMNSKPGSVVHQLFARSSVDARMVAPWRHFWDEEDEEKYTEELSDGVGGERKDGQDEIIVDAMADLSINPAINSKSMEGGYMMEGMPLDFTIYCTEIDSGDTTIRSDVPREDIKNNYKDLRTVLASRRLNTHVSPQDYQHSTSPIPVRYICDYTLNKFTRWLRILGLDVTLETEEEEKERTSIGGKIALFEHCKKERRTLLTTSYKLLLRKDCPPGAYLLDPKSTSSLEQALPRLLTTHGVKLKPCQFLTRCVVCNGNIVPVLDDNEKRLVFQESASPFRHRKSHLQQLDSLISSPNNNDNHRSVFQENGAPPDLLDSKVDMEVFRCDGCRQGYWWDDRPSSSASRVFTQATKLFRLCLGGGVEVDIDVLGDKKKGKEIMGAFDFVDVRKEHCSNLESELTVIRWLRDNKLRNPFQLQSVYNVMDDSDVKVRKQSPRESIQFTNVTSEFVGLLDYVFFESSKFEKVSNLFVPTSLKAMNHNRIVGGHLLPSNEWPSDHIAVGARLAFKVDKAKVTDKIKRDPKSKSQDHLTSHPLRCGCGCVPNILSLHEMAELRKKAREEAKARAKSAASST